MGAQLEYTLLLVQTYVVKLQKKKKTNKKTEQAKPQMQDSGHLRETVGEYFWQELQLSWKPTSQALNHSSLL